MQAPEPATQRRDWQPVEQAIGHALHWLVLAHCYVAVGASSRWAFHGAKSQNNGRGRGPWSGCGGTTTH